MSLVVAGERSGVGKTTVTLAMLSYLGRQGDRVQSFKVGPDYIDPMFHHFVTGRPCRNLDPVLTSEPYVQQCFAQQTQAVTHALVEGVMGLFDGAAGRSDFASTAHIARLLELPLVLVLDCGRLSHSIAALVHGYRSFDPRLQFAGVILNRVGSDRHLDLLRSALEPLHIPILGVLRRQEAITIPDRHLGLVPTVELPELRAVVDRLAELAADWFDWPQLLPLLQVDPRSPDSSDFPEPRIPVRLAIAQDPAFSFYYADNLDSLQALGAELLPWSPLQDSWLPEGCQGLYLGGGFPEVFAAALAANVMARDAVRSAIQAGMPTYAECGGLMYLSQAITDFSGQSFPMVGLLPTEAVMGQRLTLGYRQAIAQRDTPLLRQTQTVWGHEFHRSQISSAPDRPVYQFVHPNQAAYPEGWQAQSLHASYLHLHWGDRWELPRRFLRHCCQSAGGNN